MVTGRTRPSTEIGRRLRVLRQQKGLTQSQLAAPRFTYNYVSLIESGRRQPSDAALKHFATKLGLDAEELRTGAPAGLAQTLRLEINRARVALSGSDRSAALKSLRSTRRRAREAGLRRIEARAVELQGLAAEQLGDHDEAVRTYEEAEALLAEESATARAYAVAGRVRCLHELGDLHHAIYVGERYLDELARDALGSPEARLKVLSPLVYAYLAAGAIGRADDAANQCLKLSARVTDPTTLAGMYVNVAATQFERGHLLDADESLSNAELFFDQAQLLNELGLVHLARGVALGRNSELTVARDHLRKASGLLDESGNVTQRANAMIELARLDRLDQQAGEAEKLLTRALGELGPDGPVRLRAWAHRERGLALLMQDRPKRSEKDLREAIELFTQAEHHAEVARTHLLMAEAQADRGDRNAALESSKAALVALQRVPPM